MLRPFGFPRSGVASEELPAMELDAAPGLRGARPPRGSLGEAQVADASSREGHHRIRVATSHTRAHR
jgi:hypothetical protein